MATTDANAELRKQRAALSKAGLRPLQIWVPDTRQPNFAEESVRQSRVTALADAADADLQCLMNEALAEATGWTKQGE